MPNARRAALTALEKCRRNGAWSDAVMGSILDGEGLLGRDRALATAICYGVMQNRMLLDYYIASCSSLKLSKVEPKVLDLLRISAYQILLMDKIPDSAAVNEAVKLCRAMKCQRAAGYVNAVLRKLSGNKTALPPIKASSNVEYLSTRYSHPLWLCAQLTEMLGAEEAERFLICCNSPAETSFQVNTLKTDVDTLKASLAEEGVETVEHSFLPNCLTTAETGDITRLSAFKRGEFFVQDAAARLSVSIAGIAPGQRVLDCCSAPGGKTFAACVESRGKAKVYSCDIHENKLKRIRESAERLGFNNISTFSRDGRINDPEWNEGFDTVIADVPCSGLGVIRKKPDIRYKDPAELDSLPAIQLDILANASRYVKPGGTLVYSTCTIRKAENEDVVSDFLKAHPEFSAENFSTGAGNSVDGCLQLWPQRHGTDGFFMAKMRKKD